MARATKLIGAALLVGSVAGGLIWATRPVPRPPQEGPLRGGAAVSSIRSEPQTFNRLVGRDPVTDTVASLTHAKLVRVNRVTQELEPWLAESWTRSADGLSYSVRLRHGLTFSDQVPFTSADVVFTFQAVYDPKVGSALAESLRVGGKPLQVSAPDQDTVIITFPSLFGPGLRLLDNLPILPRHRLEPALKSGALAEAWGVRTPPGEMAGLGPFVLAEYEAGQRDRNRPLRQHPEADRDVHQHQEQTPPRRMAFGEREEQQRQPHEHRDVDVDEDAAREHQQAGGNRQSERSPQCGIQRRAVAVSPWQA